MTALSTALRALLAAAWCDLRHHQEVSRHGDTEIVGCLDGCPTRVRPARLSRAERARHQQALRAANELLRRRP